MSIFTTIEKRGTGRTTRAFERACLFAQLNPRRRIIFIMANVRELGHFIWDHRSHPKNLRCVSAGRSLRGLCLGGDAFFDHNVPESIVEQNLHLITGGPTVSTVDFCTNGYQKN